MNCAADGLECTTRTDGFGPAVMCNCHFKGSWNENTLSSADIALLSQHVHGGSTHAQFYARSLLFCTVAPLPFFSHAWQSPAYCEGGGRRGVQNCKPHSDSVRLKCHFIRSASVFISSASITLSSEKILPFLCSIFFLCLPVLREGLHDKCYSDLNSLPW